MEQLARSRQLRNLGIHRTAGNTAATKYYITLEVIRVSRVRAMFVPCMFTRLQTAPGTSPVLFAPPPGSCCA